MSTLWKRTLCTGIHANPPPAGPQVSELGAQLREAQTRMLLSEEAGRQQAAEVVVLQQALGLRGELGLGGGGLGALDGQAQLLQALARVGRRGIWARGAGPGGACGPACCRALACGYGKHPCRGAYQTHVFASSHHRTTVSSRPLGAVGPGSPCPSCPAVPAPLSLYLDLKTETS